jgi:hypothetical protein
MVKFDARVLAAPTSCRTEKAPAHCQGVDLQLLCVKLIGGIWKQFLLTILVVRRTCRLLPDPRQPDLCGAALGGVIT